MRSETASSHICCFDNPPSMSSCALPLSATSLAAMATLWQAKMWVVLQVGLLSEVVFTSPLVTRFDG